MYGSEHNNIVMREYNCKPIVKSNRKYECKCTTV